MSLINLDVSSYNEFRRQVLERASQNLGYNVDGDFGYQCWDLAAELWMNIPEFSGGIYYPQTGPNMYASECWTVSRDVNSGMSFEQIWHFEDVKRGDCIVIASSPISTTGHIAFADEDYNGSNNINLLGQNQINPSLTEGHIPSVNSIDVGTYFLGAFRYKLWKQPEPTPPSEKKKGYKFHIYGAVPRLRKINNLLTLK